MARDVGYKRPKDTKKTLKRLFYYLGGQKVSILCVAFLVIVSSLANIMGTYLLKPIVNDYIVPMDIKGLIGMLCFMGGMYLIGVGATFGYNQLMVRTTQKIVGKIRKDLFEHTQKLPLSYFDTHTHGDLMSRFTNDVDTITEAFNNSFTLLIQSFIMVTGTIIMLIVLDFRLSAIVIFFMILMFLFIQYNNHHQCSLFVM